MGQMAGGAKFIKGSFTVPSNATSYMLDFGKSFAKYLYIIEADATSKSEIVNSAQAYQKTYAMFGIYPNTAINNAEYNANTAYLRITPSTGVTVSSVNNANPAASSITISASALTTNSANALYRGLTYNYYIVEIK